MSTLGAELTAVVQGGVEIRMPFSPNPTQQNSYLHAGAITTVLDSACGYAALTVAPNDKEVLHRGAKGEPPRARCGRGLRG
jgi:acyl-coenzyme A thioesterase PaaI-like protein